MIGGTSSASHFSICIWTRSFEHSLDILSTRPESFYSEHHEGDGQALFDAASKLNYESIISKLVDAPYRSDRVEAWQKIKTVQREEFPRHRICQRSCRRCRSVSWQTGWQGAAVHGKVGTGWSRTKSAEIRKALDTVISPKQKLSKPIKKPKVTWVEPKFYADVEYRDRTSPLKACSGRAHLNGYPRSSSCVRDPYRSLLKTHSQRREYRD
ncbi:ATP-dependent DNA ligase [Bradyrhizobium sp. GM2.4]